MDDRELLAQIGESLFGPHWQADMATALGVSKRSLRHWMHDSAVPAGVFRDLDSIIQARKQALDRLHQALIER